VHCVAWGEAEAKRTNQTLAVVMKPVLPNIRFPNMFTQEIASIVKPTGLLSNKQLLALYSYLGNRRSKLNTNVCPFSTKPRKPLDPEYTSMLVWDPSRKHNSCTLSQNNTVCNASNSSNRHVAAKLVMRPKDKASYKWLVELRGSDAYAMIGVVRDSYTNLNRGGYIADSTMGGHALYTTSTWTCYDNGQSRSLSGHSGRGNRTIAIKMDMKTRNISYWKDSFKGQLIGSFPVRNGTSALRPAVTLYRGTCTIKKAP
jgi:hypothetical protein